MSVNAVAPLMRTLVTLNVNTGGGVQRGARLLLDVQRRIGLRRRNWALPFDFPHCRADVRRHFRRTASERHRQRQEP
jgi:hypothetical protein